ncbi:hypothetical protein [Clostridium saccharoperbutylacetonicum]|uniref:hypothetical protein n=1 Tax=Clostridium saccharoperbutylacetonicum TaxID=36745 RepID=UPI0039EC65D1
MYLLLTLIGLTIVFFLIGYAINNLTLYHEGTWAYCISAMILIAALIALICLPISRFSTSEQIQEFKSKQITIEQQRNGNASELEKATISREIIDYNAELSNYKYEASNKWISIYYNQEGLDLELLK